MKNLWNYIVNFFKTEWEKMKPLTFQQKMEYIWEYYRVHIIAAAAIIIMTISITSTIIKAHAGGEVVFGIGEANDLYYEEEMMASIASGFGEYLGLTYGEQQVKNNGSYTVGNTGQEYAEVTSILMMVDAGSGTLDAVLCQSDVIEYFYDSGEKAWIDLTTLLSEEELKDLGTRVYYSYDPEGNLYPCGIYLQNSKVCADAGFQLTDAMVAFPAGAVHVDYMDEFLDYILAE